MAGIKHTYGLTVRNSGGTVVTSDATAYTGDAEVNFADTIAGGETLELDLDIDVDQIVAFYIEASQDCKLNTNAEADIDADQTFNLKAKQAIWWNGALKDANGDLGDNPLTASDPITKLFFVNDGVDAAQCTVKGGFLLAVAGP